jgi:hypothetical protein
MWAGLAGLFSMSAHAEANARFHSEFVIQVTAGDWGSARESDIEAVLNSVAAVLGPYFPQRASTRVQVAFSAVGPRVLLDTASGGTHIVLLSARDTHWAQFSYQFAHELCHIFANYEHSLGNANADLRAHQWFEESLCETVSIVTLNAMATRWELAPPYEQWRSYAPAFRDYVQQLLAEEHRRLPPDRTLAQWLNEHQAELEANPYLRDRNEVVASQLLALLDGAPGALAAIAFLNLAPQSAHGSLGAYLATWRSNSPEGSREFIDRVVTLFAATGGEPGVPHHSPVAVVPLISTDTATDRAAGR